MLLCVGSLSNVGGKEHPGEHGISAKMPGVVPPWSRPTSFAAVREQNCIPFWKLRGSGLEATSDIFTPSNMQMPKATSIDDIDWNVWDIFEKGAQL